VEAAKVIENTQRDLNIAFMNEWSLIFQSLGIDTGDVLAAAATKWNFLPFRPGLVGGHCIGVDRYYLTYRAEKAGHHPEVILAGRRINDKLGREIARECIRGLLRRKGRAGVVTILGITFKENVPDIRNFRIIDVVRELKSVGVKVQIADPLADPHAGEEEYGVALSDIDALEPADALILAVARDAYVEGGWRLVQRLLHEGAGLILDVKMKLDRSTKPLGVELWRL
jgi:UDP-N-acetyl-D-galactosamine dehydrogenase